MADRTYAWRITEDTRERPRLAAGYTTVDDGPAEGDVARSIIEKARETDPALAAMRVNLYLWSKTSLLPDDWPVPRKSDRDPYGNDHAPPDAAFFSYAPLGREAPADRIPADVLADALGQYDGRIAIQTALNVAARHGDDPA